MKALDKESGSRDGEKKENANYRKRRVRAETHWQSRQLAGAEVFAKSEMGIENHQPYKKHSRHRNAIEHEERIFRRKDSQQNGGNNPGR